MLIIMYGEVVDIDVFNHSILNLDSGSNYLKNIEEVIAPNQIPLELGGHPIYGESTLEMTLGSSAIDVEYVLYVKNLNESTHIDVEHKVRNF